MARVLFASEPRPVVTPEQLKQQENEEVLAELMATARVETNRDGSSAEARTIYVAAAATRVYSLRRWPCARGLRHWTRGRRRPVCKSTALDAAASQDRLRQRDEAASLHGPSTS